MLRSVLAALLLGLSAQAALSAASQTPIGFQPDPALLTASRADIQARFQRSCQATQARVQNVAETAVARPCGCYAQRTLRALDAAELEAYRTTAVFNDTARAKALAAVDACRLQRPI
jgi:hypothetical protein